MEGQKLFKKEINPYSVSDKATFRNVDKTRTLYVRSDNQRSGIGADIQGKRFIYIPKRGLIGHRIRIDFFLKQFLTLHFK